MVMPKIIYSIRLQFLKILSSSYKCNFLVQD